MKTQNKRQHKISQVDEDERGQHQAVDDDMSFITYIGTLAFFAEKFNMTASETVALMGAHNLGLANITTSGYSGQWVIGQGGKL